MTTASSIFSLIQVGFSMDLPREELFSLRRLVMRCLVGMEKQFRTPVPRYVSS